MSEQASHQPETGFTHSPELEDKSAEYQAVIDRYPYGIMWPNDYDEENMRTWHQDKCYLRDQNGRFANFITEKNSTGRPLSQYDLELLYFCAGPEQADTIANQLIRYKDVVDSDPQENFLALQILRRIGQPEQIPKLLEFAKARWDLDDPDRIAPTLPETESVIVALNGIAINTGTALDQEIAEVASPWDLDRNRLEQLKQMAKSELEEYEKNFEYHPPLTDDDEAAWDDWDEYVAREQDYENQQRVSVVSKLQHQVHPEKTLKYLPRLEFHEQNPSPYAVDLGIEIEVYEPTLIPKDLDEEEKTQLRGKYHEKFRLTRDLGVPSGLDGFWEFANRPANYYETLGREVQALIDMGLINTEHKRHPLHLTIGGISTEGRERQEVYVLARSLEATGWSTTGGRLLRPALTNQLSWTHKGAAGVNERYPSDLENAQTAVELRTFQFQSLDGLQRTLSSAYYLGSALKAFQEVGDGEGQDDQHRLARVWEDFSRATKDLFLDYGIDDPSVIWPSPNDSPSGQFWDLAELLNQAKGEPGSEGSEFVTQMRRLVIRARRDAKAIIHPEKTGQSRARASV